MLPLFQIVKDAINKLSDIQKIRYNQRTHEVEIFGKHDDINVIATVQLKPYIPIESFGGERGKFRNTIHHKTIKNKKVGKKIKEIPVTVYDITETEENFIKISYMYFHLSQKQISEISGIPQTVVDRYIRRNKLKPAYFNSPKKERFKEYTPEEIDAEITRLEKLRAEIDSKIKEREFLVDTSRRTIMPIDDYPDILYKHKIKLSSLYEVMMKKSDEKLIHHTSKSILPVNPHHDKHWLSTKSNSNNQQFTIQKI